MAGPGGTEVGRVSVKVVPDVDGFREKVKRELQEVEKMQAQIEVTIDLTKFKAQIEEIKLLLKSIGDETVNIRVNQTGGLGGVADDAKRAAKEAENLGKRLKEALGDGEEHRLSRFTSVMQSLGSVLERTGTAALGLAQKLGSELSDGFRSVFSSLTSMIAALILWIPLLSALMGTVTFLIGFLAAGLATLPALLFGILGPLAAVVLGFDGIKQAAKTLAPEIDKVKKRLSNTFAKELTPMFKEIKKVFPAISDGLNNIAVGVSRFVTQLSRVFTSTEGIKLLGKALDNVNVLLDNMLPGMEKLLTSFLKIGAESEVFKQLGKAFSAVLEEISNFFSLSLEDGSLVKGVKNFTIILRDLSTLFARLLLNSLDFFNGASPGMHKFFDALEGFFKKIDFEKLGKAFGGVFERLGEAISQIPQETITSIGDSFVALADAIGDILDGKSFDVLVAGFQMFIDIVTIAMHIIDGLLESFAHIGDFFANVGEWFANIDLGKMFDSLGEGIKTKWEELMEWFRGIPEFIKGLFVDVGTWLFAPGTGIITGFLEGIIFKAVEVWAWFMNLPTVISNFFADAGNWLLDKGIQILTGLWNGIVQKFDDIMVFLSQIPGKVQKFFSGAGTWLLDAGKKIMQGLIDGIEGMISKLLGVLQKITLLIPIKKGPPSKDKVLLFGAGQLIMQGLINGLQTGFAPVSSLLTSMSDEIGAAFGGSALIDSMRISGADISAVGTNQLQIAGQVDSNSLENRIVDALNGWTIDGKGVARVVNNTNTRQSRRG